VRSGQLLLVTARYLYSQDHMTSCDMKNIKRAIAVVKLFTKTINAMCSAGKTNNTAPAGRRAKYMHLRRADAHKPVVAHIKQRAGLRCKRGEGNNKEI